MSASGTELPVGVRIRPLTSELVPEALALKDRSWRETYADWLREDALDRLDSQRPQHIEEWRDALASGRMHGWVALAEPAAGREPTATARVPDAAVSPRVVGVASSRTAWSERDRAETDVNAELGSLYVAKDWQGAGIAAPLMRAAVGTGPALLWVLQGNERAIAFYRRHGFELDGGEHRMAPHWNGAVALRMVRRDFVG